MVKAKIGRQRLSQPLSARFMEAVDAAAMYIGDTASDQYLADWRQSEPIEIEGEPRAFLQQLSERLEVDYPADRLGEMVANGGFDV